MFVVGCDGFQPNRRPRPGPDPGPLGRWLEKRPQIKSGAWCDRWIAKPVGWVSTHQIRFRRRDGIGGFAPTLRPRPTSTPISGRAADRGVSNLPGNRPGDGFGCERAKPRNWAERQDQPPNPISGRSADRGRGRNAPSLGGGRSRARRGRVRSLFRFESKLLRQEILALDQGSDADRYEPRHV